MTQSNSSSIGNITGTKYLENYNIYKQTLIKGLARGKSHFSNLFATWNCEVFPHSQVGDLDVISDSQSTSCISGRNMGGKQGVDVNLNNVANILNQLSFEENKEDKEKGNRSVGHCHHVNKGHESDNGFDDSDHYNRDKDEDFYVSQPHHIESKSPTPADLLVPSSSFTGITEPGPITTTDISSQTPETQLMVKFIVTNPLTQT